LGNNSAIFPIGIVSRYYSQHRKMGRVIRIVDKNIKDLRAKVHYLDRFGFVHLLYRAVCPPSTAKTIPVTILDAAEDR
jgi:hypothetical protein